MLVEQGGAIAGLSAESEIFNVIAGRYSGTLNLNVFLKGHAGDSLRVNRQSRAPETIERPALTLGICTQPGALGEFAATPGANDRGLFARFLFSIPDSNIDGRETEPEPADPTTHLAWESNLATLILSMRDLTEPITLTLSPKAEGGKLAGLRDWASKAVGTMVRIAGLLHLAGHLTDGFERPISFETMAGAQSLIDYYTDQALAVFDLMSTDPATARARAVWDWIERTGTVRFTARDAFSSLTRTKFPKMADLEPALAVLEQHGYLRRLSALPTTGRGRPPAPEYETNPRAA
jgi:replicative DNA helicase